MKKRILTGDRPTGQLHIGHLCGALKNRVALQDEYDTFVIIPDVQALTDNYKNPQKVRKNVREVVMDNLAVGVDPKKSTFFIQSLIPEIAELTVFFSNLVTISELKRNPTVKEEISQKQELFKDDVTFGFLGYPVSQAADIAIFQADLVPVGADQLPMVEQTREIVRKFNRIYGDTLKLPEAKVGTFARVLGMDGRKMGKSLNNSIALTDSADVIRKKIKEALTGEVGGKNLLSLLGEFCDNKKIINKFDKEYAQGTIKYSELKPILSDCIIEKLKPIQEKRKYYEAHPEVVDKILKDGTKKAGDADKTEIETIYKISQISPDIDFSSVLRSYLKEKPLSEYHAESIIFADADLQMKVFDQIKSHKDYDKFFKESPKFRTRMRESVPQLFVDFSPGTKTEDAAELKYLVGKSRLLSNYERMIDPRKPSEERINGVFEKARQALQAINPEKYDELAANLDNYQLIKQYDKLYQELKT